MTEKINYLLSFTFINLFISFYTVRTDLNKFLFILLFTLLISVILIFYEIYKKNYLSNFFDFDKNELGFIAILAILFLIYFIDPSNNLNSSLLDKASCKNDLIFLTYELTFLKKFFCKFYFNIYIIFFLFVYLILRKIAKKINLAKIFIITSIFFSILAIINTISFFYINEIYFRNPDNLELKNIYSTFTKYNNSGLYAYFQLLPIGASGYRNIEVFTILPGYLASVYLLLKSTNKNISKEVFLNIFLFIIVFLSYSRTAWVTMGVLEILLIIYFFIKKNLFYKKLFLINIKKIFYLTLTIILLNIFLQSDIFIKDNKQRNNLIYYTLFKVSTLTPFTKIQDYFNFKNSQAWTYWEIKNLDLSENNNRKQYFKANVKEKMREHFKANVKEKMREHLNSNISRKQIYSQAYEKFKVKKFFGYGMSNFEFDIKMNSSKKISTSKGNAESQIIQIILEKGIIGSTIFLVFLVKIFNRNLIISLENILLVGVCIYSIFVTLQFYFFYWIIISCCCALKFSQTKNIR